MPLTSASHAVNSSFLALKCDELMMPREPNFFWSIAPGATRDALESDDELDELEDDDELELERDRLCFRCFRLLLCLLCFRCLCLRCLLLDLDLERERDLLDDADRDR